jgi:hypothetical protein
LNEPYRPLLYLPLRPGAAREVRPARARCVAARETLAALETGGAVRRSAHPRRQARYLLGQRLAEIRAPERAAQWLVRGRRGGAQFGLVLMSLWALRGLRGRAAARRRSAYGSRSERHRAPVVYMVVRPAVLLIRDRGDPSAPRSASPPRRSWSRTSVGLADVEPGAGVPMIALMGIIAVVAALVPGRRASRVDPVVALRAE